MDHRTCDPKNLDEQTHPWGVCQHPVGYPAKPKSIHGRKIVGTKAELIEES